MLDVKLSYSGPLSFISALSLLLTAPSFRWDGLTRIGVGRLAAVELFAVPA